MIRVLVLAVSAAFVLAPAIAYAHCGAQHTAQTAQAASTDLAAKKKAATADDRRQGRCHQGGAREVAAAA